MAGILDIDLPTPRPGLPGPPRPAGQHAIHHVHPARYRSDDIIGLAHTHQIARLVPGQHIRRVVQHAKHGLLPFTHGQPADRITIKADFNQFLRTCGTKFARYAALLNPEKRMAGTLAKCRFGAPGPAHRQFHTIGHRLVGCRQCGAFVETHHDIAPQQRLNLHRPLRREHMFRAVDMAAKGHALLGQFAQIGQTHDLKAARIRQYRPLPVHEFVEPSQRRDPLGCGAQHQVVGIAQQDIGAGRGNAFGHHRLYRRSGADRHEGWRADIAATGRNIPRARAPVCRRHLEAEILRHHRLPLNFVEDALNPHPVVCKMPRRPMRANVRNLSCPKMP